MHFKPGTINNEIHIIQVYKRKKAFCHNVFILLWYKLLVKYETISSLLLNIVEKSESIFQKILYNLQR